MIALGPAPESRRLKRSGSLPGFPSRRSLAIDKTATRNVLRQESSRRRPVLLAGLASLVPAVALIGLGIVLLVVRRGGVRTELAAEARVAARRTAEWIDAEARAELDQIAGRLATAVMAPTTSTTGWLRFDLVTVPGAEGELTGGPDLSRTLVTGAPAAIEMAAGQPVASDPDRAHPALDPTLFLPDLERLQQREADARRWEASR